MTASGNSERRIEAAVVWPRCLVVISLFSAWPLLNFVHQNRQQLDSSGLSYVLVLLLLTLMLAYAGFFLLNRISGGRRTIAAAVSIVFFVLIFFSYHIIIDELITLFTQLEMAKGENYAYLSLFALGFLISFLLFNGRVVLDLLLVFGLVVCAIPAVGFTYFVLLNGLEGVVRKHDVVPQVKPALSFIQSPNIFHIVLDAYSRADLLEEMLGWDNSEFIASLRQQGFYVADRSFSNYPQTFLSIASSLEMDYPVTDKTERFSSRGKFNKSIQGDNPVVRNLRQNQYRFAYLGSGRWDASKCGGYEDLCLSSNNAVEQAILYLTPLRRFVESQRTTASDISSQLNRILDSAAPTYTFAHLLIPHPPRTFAADCKQLSVKGSRPMTDYWGDKEGYINDIKCLNSQLLELITAIVERDASAVIILHGDHGTAFSVDWNAPIDQWPESQALERFAILMGARLPDQCLKHVYEELSPVNIYPLLFACLRGREPELLPDMSYIVPKEKHEHHGTAFEYRYE